MFTGLITAVERLASLQGQCLAVPVPSQWQDEPIAIGESIAVNGCCLTVVDLANRQMAFDLSLETLNRTTFGTLRQESFLNLERCLRANDRLGGHIVQGHVDGVGTIVAIQEMDGSKWFDFEIPEEFSALLVAKGSIAIDGISLTIVEPRGNQFSAAVIPHTLRQTNLVFHSVGDRVNVEMDILAKTLAQLAEPYFRQEIP